MEQDPVLHLETTALRSGAELEAFFTEWKECRLPKAEWTHAAHVAVAAYLSFQHGGEAAFALMKPLIQQYNLAVGGQNTETSGYHETLTRFWMDTVARETARESQLLPAVRKAVAKFGLRSDWHKRHYSFDVVKSVQARREYVAPDLLPEEAS